MAMGKAAKRAESEVAGRSQDMEGHSCNMASMPSARCMSVWVKGSDVI